MLTSFDNFKINFLIILSEATPKTSLLYRSNFLLPLRQHIFTFFYMPNGNGNKKSNGIENFVRKKA